MHDKTMRILLTTNENFAQHAAVCVRSIIVNNPRADICFIVAALQLSQETKARLCSLAQPPRITLTVLDFDPAKLHGFPENESYSRDIYLRLWVDEFFTGIDDDKVLYLDSDTIVVNPLDDLFQIDLGDNILAAVTIPDATSHHRCHVPINYEYFNSGVLLFNLKLWRQEHCREQVQDFLKENKEIAKNPDQDALNGCFYQRRVKLDYRFNLISTFFRKNGFPSINPKRLHEIRKQAVVVHFNGIARPWLYSCNHPYQRQYLRYLAQTPWRDAPLEGMERLATVKKYIRKISGIESFVSISQLNGQ